MPDSPPSIVAGLPAPFIPDDLTQRIAAFAAKAEAALSVNTRRAIRSDTHRFVGWCQRQKHDALPATPATVAAYLEALGRTHRTSSVERAKASIAWLHRAAGVADPTSAPEVMLAIRTVARQRGRRRRQAEGLTRERVDAILAKLGTSLIDRRDAALLSVAYDTLFRRSELVTIDAAQVSIDSDASGAVHLPRSKTDQEGEGAHAYLAPDTVRRLRDYRRAVLALRPDLRTATNELGTGPLWLRIDRNGRPQGPLAVNGPDPGKRISEIWKRMAESVGLDPVLFSGHSTRVGACQDLTADGHSLPAIQQVGRWKSPSMPARYGEKLAVKHNAMAQMAKRQGRQ